MQQEQRFIRSFFQCLHLFFILDSFCFGNYGRKERFSYHNPCSSVPVAERMQSVFPEGFAEGSSRVLIVTRLPHISLDKRLHLEWTGFRFSRFVEAWNLILTLPCHPLIHGFTTIHWHHCEHLMDVSFDLSLVGWFISCSEKYRTQGLKQTSLH